MRFHLRWLCAWLALGLGLGCSEEDAVFTGDLVAPSGVVVAGSTNERLFIANAGEDSLQVVERDSVLEDAIADGTVSDGLNSDFVPAPMGFFPLRISAGPEPKDLVATADGKFIVVLSAVDHALRVIDADGLRAMTTDGESVRLQLGGDDRRARALASSPRCYDEAPCGGRIFAAVSGDLVEIDVAADGQSLAVVRTVTVGGVPIALAISADGEFVYATDAVSNEVIRLRTADDTVERLDIGALGGALALSTDEAHLVVSRPSLKDVVVVSDPKDAWSMYTANAEGGLVPDCLAPCDDTALCADAHPLSTSICLGDEGLEATGMSYAGLYVGQVVTRIAAVGAGAGQRGITYDSCAEALEVPEAMALAQLNGGVHLMALPTVDRDFAHLLGPDAGDDDDFSEAWCVAAELSEDEDIGNTIAAETVLADCPSMPAENRYQCAGQVGVFVGGSKRQRLRMFWEGSVVARVSGGGELSEDGSRFADNGVAFANYDIRPGDVLEIISAPATDSACADAEFGGSVACDLERRITSVSGGDLVLDRPIATSCFRGGGSIAYRIRAGDVFLMRYTKVDTSGAAYGGTVHLRAAPGELLSPARVSSGDTVFPWMMALKDFSTDSGAHACDRYDDQGQLVSALDAGIVDAESGVTPVRRLDESDVDLSFIVDDHGTVIDASLVGGSRIARNPTGIAVWSGQLVSDWDNPGQVFVSFQDTEADFLVLGIFAEDIIRTTEGGAQTWIR